MFVERLLKVSDIMVFLEERVDEKEGSIIEYVGYKGEADFEREGFSKCIYIGVGELTRWYLVLV